MKNNGKIIDAILNLIGELLNRSYKLFCLNGLEFVICNCNCNIVFLVKIIEKILQY